MDKQKEVESVTDVESCLSCKLTTIACLLGIGGYFLQQSKKQERTSKIVLTALGTGSILLGIGELFDQSPFRKSTD